MLKPETGSTSTSSRPEEVDLKYGDEGFQELLKVMCDAIYVIVYRSQRVTELPF
jgi:hypothetical protein